MSRTRFVAPITVCHAAEREREREEREERERERESSARFVAQQQHAAGACSSARFVAPITVCHAAEKEREREREREEREREREREQHAVRSPDHRLPGRPVTEGLAIPDWAGHH